MNIFIITTKHNITTGQGESQINTSLAVKGPYGIDGFHPAFKIRKEAEEYIRNKYPLDITEIELL